jgi:hypothetical protein
MNLSISHSLVDELLTTIEAIGVENTIKTLQKAKSNSLILKDMNIDFILDAVADVTGVTRDRILHGNDRSDERKIAIALAVYFIKDEFLYSYADIKKIFNKDQAQLYRYYGLVDKIPDKPKTEFDKTIETYQKKLTLLITREKFK